MIEKNLSFRIVNYSCDKPTVKLTSVYHKMWKIIHVEVKNLLHIHQTKPKSGLVPCKNSLLSWLDAIIVEFTLLFWMQFYFLGCKWTCVKLNCFAWNFYYIFRTKFIPPEVFLCFCIYCWNVSFCRKNLMTMLPHHETTRVWV